MDSYSYPFKDAIELILDCDAVKVVEWDHEIVVPSDDEEDYGFFIQSRINPSRTAQISCGPVRVTYGENGFRLQFMSVKGETITVVPYIKMKLKRS